MDELRAGADAGGGEPARLTPTSVVVVTYNSLGTIATCLESVLRAEPCEIVVVDNASCDGTREWLANFASDHAGAEVVLSDANLGFSAGTNTGLSRTSGDYVVLLNPDTVVPRGWLTRLQAHFGSVAPDGNPIGAVGPVSDYVMGYQRLDVYLPPGPAPESVDAIQERLASRYDTGSVETRLLIGFCMMICRPALDAVGGLDPELFLGLDDFDLSWRLREAGWDLRVAADTFVHHRGHMSFASIGEHAESRYERESRIILARKLAAHYWPVEVPPATELWGLDVPHPNRDRHFEGTTFVAAQLGADLDSLRRALRGYLGVFHAGDEATFLVAVPPGSVWDAETLLPCIGSVVSDLGHDPATIPDVVVVPSGPDVLAGLDGRLRWVPVSPPPPGDPVDVVDTTMDPIAFWDAAAAAPTRASA